MRVLKFKKIVLFFIFFLKSSLGFSQFPTINENRPRIFVEQNRLNWLQNNISIPGDCKQTYDDMLNAYNNWWINDPELYLDGTNANVWTWNWNSIWSANQTQLTVFFYKITNQSIALQRCEYIAQQYINKINSTDFSSLGWSEKEILLRKMSDAGSILLDWCYTDLNPTLRDQLAQAHFLTTQEFVNFYLFSTEGNTSFVSSHNTS